MPYINVDVEINLCEFDTEDLIEELKEREAYVDHDVDHDIKRILNALVDAKVYTNNFDKVFADIVYEHTGRIL